MLHERLIVVARRCDARRGWARAGAAADLKVIQTQKTQGRDA